MNSQKRISKVELAKAINDFYLYCGYEISTKQIVELSKMIFQSCEHLTTESFHDFIYKAKLGKLGMIYKSPISLMVAFNDFIKTIPIPPKEKVYKEGDLIPNPDWVEPRRFSNAERQ